MKCIPVFEPANSIRIFCGSFVFLGFTRHNYNDVIASTITTQAETGWLRDRLALILDYHSSRTVLRPLLTRACLDLLRYCVVYCSARFALTCQRVHGFQTLVQVLLLFNFIGFLLMCGWIRQFHASLLLHQQWPSIKMSTHG